MDTIREVLDPHFLLRNSVLISIAFGLVCPLVGLWLILRRMVFLGVTLPQASSCGVAFAFALQGWGLLPHPHETAGEHVLALLGSAAFTLVAILLLSLLARRRREAAEASVGAAYALAGAWAILLLVKNPIGEHGLLELLRGEIIAISDFELIVAVVLFAAVAAALALFHRRFLLVSFDPELAISLKKNLAAWDTSLLLLISVTISVAVLSAGPLVTFGFLLLPALTARLFARNMGQFALLAAALGGFAALAGFCIAYRWDLPVGATDVALLGVLYGLANLAKTLLHRS